VVADMPEEKTDFFLSKLSFEKFTENTITSIQAFKVQLQKVRENGFAWSIEESNYGLNTVAAPIHRNDGDVLAALLVLVPTVRVSEAKLINEYGPQVAKMAKRISFDMGFREKDAE
jgi:DNA-binding IclR family transcriptional regulator